ncbi:hypothetical protein [Nocardia sp. NPDC051981]|uniref:hypothetical protein n=1 Tax=Nocardia sp. NPDC051981 TaxID=3155417 RepID=UPI0034484499
MRVFTCSGRTRPSAWHGPREAGPRVAKRRTADLTHDGLDTNRMKLRSTTAAAALVIGAMTIGMTTAHADEAPAQPAGINYSSKLVDAKFVDGKMVQDKTIVSTLKNGVFELAEQDGDTPTDPKQTIVNVKDPQGATVVSFPLNYSVAGTKIPVKAALKADNTVLEVVPEKPAGFDAGTLPAFTHPVMVVKDIASPVEDQRAMNNFTTEFGLATAIGGFVGTAVGVVLGGGIGIALGAIECLTVVGCLASIPTFVALAGIGGILGTIAFGAPALGIAGMDLINTLQAAPGTSKWSDSNMNGTAATTQATPN